MEMMDVKERWDGRRERERHKEKEICELAGVIVCVSNMSMSAEQSSKIIVIYRMKMSEKNSSC